MGILDGGDNPDAVDYHVFAHDDEYAYDSLGRHPLPYTGVGPYPLRQLLDQDPADYHFLCPDRKIYGPGDNAD